MHQANGIVVVDEVELLLGPWATDLVLNVLRGLPGEVVVLVTSRQQAVIVVMPDVPNDDFTRLEALDALRASAAVHGPPQVELHATVAAEGRPSPAPVPFTLAALDHGHPPVGGESLNHCAGGFP